MSDHSDYEPVGLAEEADRPESIHVKNMCYLHRKMIENGIDPVERAREALTALEKYDINLTILLDIVLWGSDASIADPKINYARTALVLSDEFPAIKLALYSAPKQPRGCRTVRGRNCGANH